MLTISPDKVIDAASRFPESANLLKTLFPEAFDIVINSETALMKEFPYAVGFVIKSGNLNCDLITVYAPQQGYKGFVLNNSFNWKMEKVDGSLQLIPTRK